MWPALIVGEGIDLRIFEGGLGRFQATGIIVRRGVRGFQYIIKGSLLMFLMDSVSVVCVCVCVGVSYS